MTKHGNVDAGGWANELAADRERLDRGSVAEMVADVLRQRITDGFFTPGARLSETDLCTALGVSRNTLREAFRLLGHEGLVAHELHRGVFVRVPTETDIVDLYRARAVVECGALRAAHAARDRLDDVRSAVGDGVRAAAADDWRAVGTADLRFHRALTSLAGSTRLDDLMRRILAELRLIFHLMASPRELHEPYLARNHEILQLLDAGDPWAAADVLMVYLADAERQLIAAARRLPA